MDKLVKSTLLKGVVLPVRIGVGAPNNAHSNAIYKYLSILKVTMNQRIMIAAPGPVGPTFMEWSIYFLAGQKEYWRWPTGVESVVDSPLQQGSTTYSNIQTDESFNKKYLGDIINAHTHKKNVCFGFDKLKEMLDDFDKEVINGHHAWHQMFEFFSLITKKLNVHPDELSNSEISNKILDAMYEDFTKSIDYALNKDFKLIYIHPDPSIPLYFLNDRRPGIGPGMLDSNSAVSQSEIQKYFFKTDTGAWTENTVWDQREKVALDLRPFDVMSTRRIPNFDRKKDHYFLNCLTFWQNFERKILELMDYLEISVNSEQYNRWKPIYQEWQKIHHRYLDFQIRITDIMDAIINGYNYRIGKLTFIEEATIQHLLMYKYGLNIKTYQLETFPNNAKDLHLLLEPCCHPIQKIYN